MVVARLSEEETIGAGFASLLIIFFHLQDRTGMGARQRILLFRVMQSGPAKEWATLYQVASG